MGICEGGAGYFQTWLLAELGMGVLVRSRLATTHHGRNLYFCCIPGTGEAAKGVLEMNPGNADRGLRPVTLTAKATQMDASTGTENQLKRLKGAEVPNTSSHKTI